MSDPANRWDTFAPPSPPPTRQKSTSTPRSAPAPAPAPAKPSLACSADTFPCLFFSHDAEISHLERLYIMATIRQLPQESIVAQFCRGKSLRGLVDGAVKNEATVYKSWHQHPNHHFTVHLYWVNELGYQVEGGGYGVAHVHANGLESLVEHHTGNRVVRQPMSSAWQIFRPVFLGLEAASEHLSRTPPWRKTSVFAEPVYPPPVYAPTVTRADAGSRGELLDYEEAVDEVEEGEKLVSNLCSEPWIAK